jgi:hypothetical protein
MRDVPDGEHPPERKSVMGRTVLPFTQELYREKESWKAFRRALRRGDRELFDELFAAARYHTAACTCSGRAVPFEAILMSILIEERRAVRELSARLSALARRVEALARREETPP